MSEEEHLELAKILKERLKYRSEEYLTGEELYEEVMKIVEEILNRYDEIEGLKRKSP